MNYFKGLNGLKRHVLVVDDEMINREILSNILSSEYEVHCAENGKDALDKLEETKVNLMIVDVCMPRMDGYELVRELRSIGDATPVIMLTAMGDFSHKKKGYELGIDEYLTKPIDYEELTWHIEAILRRSRINSEKEICVGDFVISENGMYARLNDKDLDLTDTEFKLLYKLLSYPGVTFTKQQIMDEIWGYETETDYNTIKVYINRIRNKLEGCTAFEIISQRGVGYKAVINQ